jgi:S-adenosylmethionine:tRNA ribosyltransferase-isomerase
MDYPEATTTKKVSYNISLMPTDISLFDYNLPEKFIAQSPKIPRESAKLFHVHRFTGSVSHLTVKDLPTLLHPTDVLVINNTKVFNARLHEDLTESTNKPIELFLIRPLDGNTWQAIGKPWKKLSINAHIKIAPDFIATILDKKSDGTLVVTFHKTKEEVIHLANIFGSVPIPPYIKHVIDPHAYQTTYAKVTGSVAAPTAGFHLTPALLDTIKNSGVTVCEITLHVGLGTFKPVKTQTIEEHQMHSEWVSVSDTTADTIQKAKVEKRRIIAIGTTTVRTLEGIASLNNGKCKAYVGDINLFITPGFHFNVIDGMLTNFHLPKSTLLILVSAFAGRERILKAYTEAIENQYRFFSFGDAMFID